MNMESSSLIPNPPSQPEEKKANGSSPTCTKSMSERLHKKEMDLSKSKKLKVSVNSKAHYLAMQRRKKCLFKKASELSTLCGIEVCVIVYDNQKPTTAAETWPNNRNDVLGMVKRCKGRMTESQGKKPLRTEKTLLKPANVEPTSTNSESRSLDSMMISSQAHFADSSQMQTFGVSDNIEGVCSPPDIILEDGDFWKNLYESVGNSDSSLLDSMMITNQAPFADSSQMQSYGVSDNIEGVCSPPDIILEDEDLWKNLYQSVGNSESRLLDSMMITSQAHFADSSQIQSYGVSDHIEGVCSPPDIIVEDEDFWKNLYESAGNCSPDFANIF